MGAAGKLVKAVKKTSRTIADLSGVNLKRMMGSIANAPRFMGDMRQYKKMAQGSEFPLIMENMVPNLHDYKQQAGYIDGHYFLQDIWAAREVLKARPARHYDIGSRVDGFISHLLVSMPVTMIDIRPLDMEIPGLDFIRGDATGLALEDGSLESVSSLHAVEHFGLGRYGDPVDPDAWKKVLAEMQRVLKPGGRLYFSVPVGRQRVVFNSHRVFHPRTIADSLPQLKLVKFSGIDDSGRLRENIALEELAQAGYGCGLFIFERPA